MGTISRSATITRVAVSLRGPSQDGTLLGRDLCIEAKARAQGFRELYSWLNERDALIVKADRLEPLVVVRLSLAAEFAKLVG